MGTAVADSFGQVVTAAQTTFGDSSGRGDVPDAIAVSDQAVEQFAQDHNMDWDTARRQMQDTGNTARSALGAGGTVPTALAQSGDAANRVLAGTLPAGARQSADALRATGSAASGIIQPFDLLKDALGKLGTTGFGAVHDAAVNLESQFPGLTAQIDAYIATLGKIPTTVNTNVVTTFSTVGSPSGGGGGGGGSSGGGGGGSNNLARYAGQGSAGSYTLPNIVTGGQITVSGSNLSNAISNAAAATGVSVNAQAGGGTFGRYTNSNLSFDEGGWVPGPKGAPVVATVHGGEYVIPTSAMSSSGSSGSGGITDAQMARLASMIAAELQHVSLSVSVDDIHGGLLRKGRHGPLGLP